MQERITKLRALFVQHKIDAYIIPYNDRYFSEYVPENARRLQYITNFTGSNGMVVICKDKAVFFTDGRYLEQSKRQLDLHIFEIFDIRNLALFPWDNYLGSSGILGYDLRLFTNVRLAVFTKIKSRLREISDNLVDQIWHDRPSESASKIYVHHDEFAGRSYSDKIAMCRELLTKHAADSMIITSLDSICWLLNLRASDVPYTPLMLATTLITKDQLYLLVSPDRVDREVMMARPDITILPEEKLACLLEQTHKVLVDDNFTSNYIINLLSTKIVEKINDPCQLAKACKNSIEINHAINFHIQDAVALCEFLAYLFTIPNLSDQSEYSLGERLAEFRSKQDRYVMDSFPTICGFQENSAIIHYRATKSQAKRIVGTGILLIDSGAQYLGCTTDVTRTVAIGDLPSNEQKLRYTQVLKGHIALSMIKFPANATTGGNLDVLARQFLWKNGVDYPHGTGHGVGNFLSVHEGPQNISLRSNVILEPGMIVSNEPGYYKVNEFGIRIENLMYVKNNIQNDNYLEFDTLTLVPYAKELIDKQMLNIDEIYYINQYYQKIRQRVYPLLSAKGQEWLNEQLLFGNMDN